MGRKQRHTYATAIGCVLRAGVFDQCNVIFTGSELKRYHQVQFLDKFYEFADEVYDKLAAKQSANQKQRQAIIAS